MHCLRQGGWEKFEFLLCTFKKNIGNACENREVRLREDGVSLFHQAKLHLTQNSFYLCSQTMWILAGSVRPEA